MKYFLSVLFVIAMTSCGTIFCGLSTKVNVTSSPPGAEVHFNGKNTGQTTPCELTLRDRQAASEYNKKNAFVFTLKKEGYADYRHVDPPSTHVGAAIFDISLYLVPLAVDLATGGLIRHNKEVYANLSPITNTVIKKEVVYVNSPSNNTPAYTFAKSSDVDNNIPKIDNVNAMRFALIIGNEDYSSKQSDLNKEINVEFARNDASAMKEYAINTLGIPEKNVVFLLDATTGQMKQAISKLNLIIKNTQGNADVFVYYAGHGLPDEITKDPYLMPVDVSGKNAADGVKLKDMYDKLLEFPSQKVTVFIDACFSGGARNQGLLAARGVRINAKEDNLNGKIIVFSASSGTQSSLPYKEKQHGMFTYFLLKKLQETKGNVGYNDLSTYIGENVSLQSVMINDKEQNPQIMVSPSVENTWKSWKLR